LNWCLGICWQLDRLDDTRSLSISWIMQLCWRCFTSDGFSLGASSFTTGAYLPDRISSKFNSIPSQIITQLTHSYLKSSQTALLPSQTPYPFSNALNALTAPSLLGSDRSPSGHQSAVASKSLSLWLSLVFQARSYMIL
jgi:hypothetical protein